MGDLNEKSNVRLVGWHGDKQVDDVEMVGMLALLPIFELTLEHNNLPSSCRGIPSETRNINIDMDVFGLVKIKLREKTLERAPVEHP